MALVATMMISRGSDAAPLAWRLNRASSDFTSVYTRTVGVQKYLIIQLDIMISTKLEFPISFVEVCRFNIVLLTFSMIKILLLDNFKLVPSIDMLPDLGEVQIR